MVGVPAESGKQVCFDVAFTSLWLDARKGTFEHGVQWQRVQPLRRKKTHGPR